MGRYLQWSLRYVTRIGSGRMTIEKPSAGGIVQASWGIDVANAINRIGVGILCAFSGDVVVQPGATVILPIDAIVHDARLFFQDGQVVVSEGRRGVYVVTAYLMVKGLADNEWGRAYLYRNGSAFAGNSTVGAGGSGMPWTIAGIDAFDEGDSLQVRVNVQSEATITLANLSMTRIAENT